MGSGLAREAWIWAWEQGLTDEGVEFVVEACSAPAQLRESLRDVYSLDSTAFEKLPDHLAYDWRALRAFFNSRDFTRVRPNR